MVEKRKCRKYMCFCVFLHGRKEDMSKSVVFLCVFARSKGGNVEKGRVFYVLLVKSAKRPFQLFKFADEVGDLTDESII